MSFNSVMQKMFSPPSAAGTNLPDLEDENESNEWGQNFRIVMAIIVTLFSALVVWWIMS